MKKISKINKKFLSVILVLCLTICYTISINNNTVTAKADTLLENGAVYKIRNQKSNLYFDITMANYDNGTHLIQYVNTDCANQQFRLQLISGTTNEYHIIPIIAPEKKVDVLTNSPENDTNIGIYETTNSPAQNFKILDDGNGTGSFKIMTGSSNYTKAIVVAGASNNAGAELIQYTYANNGTSDNDHWYFEKVSSSNEFIIKLRIFSIGSSGGSSSSGSSVDSLGHAFVVVTNTSNTELIVGHVILPVCDNLTIGTWPQTNNVIGTSESGIWYNRESYHYGSGPVQNSYSIATYLTRSEFIGFNVFLSDSSNEVWTATNNCSRFATRLWNVSGDFQLSAGWPCTPQALKNNIANHSGFKTNEKIGNTSVTKGYVENGSFVPFSGYIA